MAPVYCINGMACLVKLVNGSNSKTKWRSTAFCYTGLLLLASYGTYLYAPK